MRYITRDLKKMFDNVVILFDVNNLIHPQNKLKLPNVMNRKRITIVKLSS